MSWYPHNLYVTLGVADEEPEVMHYNIDATCTGEYGMYNIYLYRKKNTRQVSYFFDLAAVDAILTQSFQLFLFYV